MNGSLAQDSQAGARKLVAANTADAPAELSARFDSGRFAGEIRLASYERTTTLGGAMWNPTEATAGAADAADMLGDIRGLAAQLSGPPEGKIMVVPPSWATVDSVPALSQLVARHVTETLAAREWPVIIRSWQLTREGKARELIQLDREWGAKARLEPCAEASYRAGRRQLNKLRGLRHERVIHRFVAAIEAGEAWGWHPLVFGVVLGVYNLPLRPGLMQFAAHTLAGLVTAAESRRRLPAVECQKVLDHVLSTLPPRLPALPDSGAWRVV